MHEFTIRNFLQFTAIFAAICSILQQYAIFCSILQEFSALCSIHLSLETDDFETDEIFSKNLISKLHEFSQLFAMILKISTIFSFKNTLKSKILSLRVIFMENVGFWLFLTFLTFKVLTC